MKFEVAFDQLAPGLGKLARDNIRLFIEDRERPTPSSNIHTQADVSFDRNMELYFPSPISKVFSHLTDAIKRFESIQPWGPLFKVVSEVNRQILVAESYFPVEKSFSNRKGPNKPYRDHLLHPTTVTLLGQSLLDCELDDGLVKDHVSNLIFETRIGKDALAFGEIRSPNQSQRRKIVSDAWLVAGLSHDIAYFVEPTFLMAESFFKAGPLADLPEDCVDLQRGLVQRMIDRRPEGISIGSHRLIKTYFLHPAQEALSKGKLDHGQFLACLWLELFLFGKKPLIPRKLDRVSFFLALLATFRHDEWSKPDNLPWIRYGRGNEGIDYWTCFFCLIDLIAEIRLIWNAVEAEFESDGGYSCSWRIRIWRPFEGITAEREGQFWFLYFARSREVREKLGSDESQMDTYDFDIATGSGNKEAAVQKKSQYRTMLKVLQLLEESGDVDVDNS